MRVGRAFMEERAPVSSTPANQARNPARTRRWLLGGLIAIALSGAASAIAAELAGIVLPDVRDVAGVRLVLNGIALRTYSIVAIRIYVAGLYLEHRSSNAEAILDLPETKLLEIHFLRSVSQERSRDAWQTGFANNCRAPCYLDPRELARFMAAVPAVQAGDVSQFVFTPQRLSITFDGRPLGTVTDRHFAREILASFIGPVPPTPRVKRELLGGG